MADASDAVDSRADRAVQGLIALVLLSGFVFHQAWVMPVLAVLIVFGALFGPPGNPFHRLFAQLVAPRISNPVESEQAATVRAQDVVTAVLLGTASLLLVIGLGAIGWVVGLLAAGAAAVAATTGVHLGDIALDRLRRRR